MQNIKLTDPSRTFLVCTPPYQHNSAGIVVLHELCDAIVRLGYVAHILLIDQQKLFISEDPRLYSPELRRVTIPPKLSENWIKQVLERGITIYPEIITGNPLNARQVVRYFLNSDGVITGKKSEYQQHDFCLAYNSVYFKNPHAILTWEKKSPLLNETNAPPWEERSLNLTYIGKGIKYLPCFRIEGSVLLSATWPQTKPELALLLQNTKYLYTWDSQSALNSDAMLCGAKIVFLQFSQASEETLKAGELGPIPYYKANFDGSSLQLIDNPYYEKMRIKYIDKIKKLEADWNNNVGATIDCIFKYFRHRSNVLTGTSN